MYVQNEKECFSVRRGRRRGRRGSDRAQRSNTLGFRSRMLEGSSDYAALV